MCKDFAVKKFNVEKKMFWKHMELSPDLDYIE